MSETVEYRVRPVTRFVVTRFRSDTEGRVGSTSELSGEYDNENTAYAVAYALAKADAERLGYSPFDERVRYPEPPGSNSADVARPAGLVQRLLGDAA